MNRPNHVAPKTLLETLPRDRAESYLNHCSGNSASASALYLWGMDMAAALHEVLSMTEVAVRGAIDAQLQSFAKSHGVTSGEWIKEKDSLPHLSELRFANGRPLFDHGSLRRMSRKQEGGRTRMHPRSQASTSHGDLIAQVMFGTWGAMLPDKNDSRPQSVQEAINSLWREALQEAFPHRITTIRRFTAPQTIGDHVRVSATLRNRVNHVDSLLNVDVESYLENTIAPLLQAIGPEIKQVIMAQSRVLAVWQRRTVPMIGPGLNIKQISRNH